jgi:hypothetical protein
MVTCDGGVNQILLAFAIRLFDTVQDVISPNPCFGGKVVHCFDGLLDAEDSVVPMKHFTTVTIVGT